MDVKAMCVGPIETNCYFLIEGDELALIDPGEGAEEIRKTIEKLGLKLKYILLTHGHYDHTTAVPDLHQHYPDAKVYIHPADANGAGSTLFPLAGQVKDLLFYDEGDTLTLGGLTIQVFHTPGHSEGCVTLQAEDTLFCGDTLFAGSCGRTDLRGGSYEKIMVSLKRLGELEGDRYVCPGHGPDSTLGIERRTNPYLRAALGLR